MSTKSDQSQTDGNRSTLSQASQIPPNHKYKREEKREECDRDAASRGCEGLPPVVASVGAGKKEEGDNAREKTERPCGWVDHTRSGDHAGRVAGWIAQVSWEYPRHGQRYGRDRQERAAG
jgi:hypothetical protein